MQEQARLLRRQWHLRIQSLISSASHLQNWTASQRITLENSSDWPSLAEATSELVSLMMEATAALQYAARDSMSTSDVTTLRTLGRSLRTYTNDLQMSQYKNPPNSLFPRNE